MKESNEINNTKEKGNFESKVMDKNGNKESLMKLLDKDSVLNLIYINKNTQTKVANSISFRTSSMYVDYLNCLQKTLDDSCGDTDDKTLYDIANKVYKSDLGGLCESLLSKKTDKQENFNFNIEKKEIDPLLKPCLKIYMMHMILLDLLSITEKDFKNCDVTEDSSMKSVMIEIIKKRQQERIEKIFDIILNKKKCEIKTFWDELKMLIDEKKYNKLRAKSESECRDTVYLFLFNKTFGKKDDDGDIVYQIDVITGKYKNTTQQEIKDRITKKENDLNEQERNLKILENKSKKLQDLKDPNKRDNAISNINNIINAEAKQYYANMFEIMFEIVNDTELEKKAKDLSHKISQTKKEIEEIKNDITDAKNDLVIRKTLDENSKFVEDMRSTAENRLENKYDFDFLLNHPDRIFNVNFSDCGITNFVSYLLKNNQHKYFYLAIIEIARVINRSTEYFFRDDAYDAISTFRKSHINVNIDFIEKILLDSVNSTDSNKVFSKYQLRWVISSWLPFDDNAKDAKITFLNIVLVILFTVLATAGVYISSKVLFMGPEVGLLFLPLGVVSAAFGIAVYASKCFAVIYFFYDYFARKKRRVIYNRAISQLNKCKQRTKVYKNKLTKQKDIFDKYLECDQEQPIQEQTETKNEEEITTQ